MNRYQAIHQNILTVAKNFAETPGPPYTHDLSIALLALHKAAKRAHQCLNAMKCSRAHAASWVKPNSDECSRRAHELQQALTLLKLPYLTPKGSGTYLTPKGAMP